MVNNSQSSAVALPVVFRSSEKFYCLQSVQKSRSTVIMSDSCEINRNHHGAPHRSCGSLTRMPRPATGKKSPGEVSARVSMQRARTGSGKAILGLFSQPSETTCPEQFREQRIGDRVRGPDRGAAAAVGEAATGPLFANAAHWRPCASLGSGATAHVDHWATTWAFKPMRRNGLTSSSRILPLVADPTAGTTPGVGGK